MVAVAIGGAAVVGAGASMMAAGEQADAARDAAGIHRDATQASIAEQRRQFDLTREDLAPYREIGTSALHELGALYGIGRGGLLPATAAEAASQPAPQPQAPQPAQAMWEERMLRSGQEHELRNQGLMVQPLEGDFEEGDFRKRFRVMDPFSGASGAATMAAGGASPGAGAQGGGNGLLPHSASMEDARNRFTASPSYQFRFDEGLRALDRSAAARGRLQGGGYGRELERYGQGLASMEFESYANRLASLAGVGQSATNTGAALGAQTAGNISNTLMAGAQGQGNALMAAGTARASGYAGAANALQGAAGNYMMYNLAQQGAFRG